jgi:hypothetical protein
MRSRGLETPGESRHPSKKEEEQHGPSLTVCAPVDFGRLALCYLSGVAAGL